MYENQFESYDKKGNEILVFFHYEYNGEDVLNCTYFYATDHKYSEHIHPDNLNMKDLKKEIEEWLEREYLSSADYYRECYNDTSDRLYDDYREDRQWN